MLSQIIYDFEIESEYTTSQVTITSGKPTLDINTVNYTDTNIFSTSTGYTYDTALSEFTGGQVQQIDQTPTNSTFYAAFSTTVNGSWGSGTITGTAVGGATISGGYLDLSQNDNRYVEYNADQNADSQQVGCIRFRVTPNYSGSPASTQNIVFISKEHNNVVNRILIYHNTGGSLSCIISSSTGATIASMATAWSPTASTEYEIELNWDLTTGATRIFVDGVQLGSTNTSTGTRDANIGIMRVGNSHSGSDTSNFKIRNLLIFSTVQHTTNYTPDWSTIYSTRYLETTVTLPEYSYTGPGYILSASSITATSTNDPRYTIKAGSGNFQYYNGSTWTSSDGTWNQSIEESTFNTNIGSLNVASQTSLQLKVHFNDTNDQQNVSNLVLSGTEQKYYSTGSILTDNYIQAESISAFQVTETQPTNTGIYYTISLDCCHKWYNGSGWTVSNQTIAQANTLSTVQNNITTLLTERSRVRFNTIFEANTALTASPQIDNITVTYDFGGVSSFTTDLINVYGIIRNPQGVVVNSATVEFTPSINLHLPVTSSDHIIATDTNTATSDSTGYFEMSLIPGDYKVKIEKKNEFKITRKLNGNPLIVTVPDSGDTNLEDLL